MTRPFRFGAQLNTASSGKEWRDKARKVEDLGYSTLYMPDHFGEQLGPIVGLTVAAEATEKLNVGALVFDNDYRHPLMLAKEMATLDLLTEGRVEFGLGAGWMKSDYDETGMPYDEPKVRVDRFEEGLQVIKGLWRDGRSDFQGEHYRMAGGQGRPRPHTPGGPKLVIGGGGKRILSIAAREADVIGVNPNLKSGYVGPEAAASAKGDLYRKRLGWIRDAAGDRFSDLELQCLVMFVQFTNDADQAIADMAPLFGLTPEEAGEVPMALVGDVDRMVETLQRRREEYGLSYIVVQEGTFEQFGEVVAKLAGT
jgi:probable F420-dependent oxidoreductase